MANLRTQFKRNVTYSVLAQGFTLLQSIVMTFIVAKVLEVEVFAYWQLFLFYSGFVSYLCFGAVDGAYLKAGGSDLESLDAGLEGSKWKTHVLLQIILGALLLLFIMTSGIEGDRLLALSCVAVYLVINNSCIYLSQLLSACNLIYRFSKAIILEKIFALSLTAVLIISGYQEFFLFIVIYCAGKAIELIACSWIARKLVTAPYIGFQASICGIFSDCKVGIFLTLSTLSSVLVSGAGRFLIDVTGTGLTVFAYMSFALNLVSFFLMFLRQVGIAVFPLLRKIDSGQQAELFSAMRQFLGLLALMMIVLYGPICWLIDSWLPAYMQSELYFLAMLPVFMFDAYMQVIYTPYLTAVRRERSLLLVNALGAITASALSAISVLWLHDVLLVAFSTSIGMGVKSVGAYMILSSHYGLIGDATRNTLIEIVMITGFIAITMNIGLVQGIIGYSVMLVAYIIVCSKKLRSGLKRFASRR